PVILGVPDHVVVVGAVPAPAMRPLRDAAARAAAVLEDGRIHARLLVEVSDDAGGLHLREPLVHEELERGLVVGVLGEGRALIRDVLVRAVGTGAAGEDHGEGEGAEEETSGGGEAGRAEHGRSLGERRARLRPALFAGKCAAPMRRGGGGRSIHWGASSPAGVTSSEARGSRSLPPRRRTRSIPGGARAP